MQKFNTYYKNPLVTQCADKYAVREYVEKCGCGEILNELYGVYDKVDDIPWDTLPNQFVIKWNFGCGQNLIVLDKTKLDIEDAKKKLNEWYKLRDTFYLTYSEMQYKGIPPKLICEKLIRVMCPWIINSIVSMGFRIVCWFVANDVKWNKVLSIISLIRIGN